jgi:hypothetical protein
LYILLTIALTFDALARYRQRHRCLSLSEHFNAPLVENRFPILFEPFALKNPNDDTYEYDIVNYQQADHGVNSFLKYLANFLFYRFGLEVEKSGREFRAKRKFFCVDMLYHHGDCHCCSTGCRGSTLCGLAWIVSGLQSTYGPTNVAVLYFFFNYRIPIAIHECRWRATLPLFW